jgi:hypothetical protein
MDGSFWVRRHDTGWGGQGQTVRCKQLPVGARRRVSEAVPLARQALEIILKVERKTGYTHPRREAAQSYYATLLSNTDRSEVEIEAEIATVARKAGLDQA